MGETGRWGREQSGRVRKRQKGIELRSQGKGLIKKEGLDRIDEECPPTKVKSLEKKRREPRGRCPGRGISQEGRLIERAFLIGGGPKASGKKGKWGIELFQRSGRKEFQGSNLKRRGKNRWSKKTGLTSFQT